MHEAGIAQAIAAEIRERGLDPAAVRVVVSGGHGDEESFDAALRMHLEASAPGLGLGSLAIVHAPVARICTRCATPFEAAFAADPCPACGGPGIAVPVPESVELEWAGEHADVADEHDEGHADADEHETPDDHAVAHRPAQLGRDHDGPDRPARDDGRPSAVAAGRGTLRP
jgi:Zn finger protein HypA/HybF involved in hydrogenase expression